MKKTAEKIALVAQICVTLIFVIVSILALCGIIDFSTSGDNSFALVVMSVLAAAYLGLSLYMIYMHFSENAVLKQVLLYSYYDSTVKATARVVKKTAVQSCRPIEGVKLKNVQIRPDDKFGLKMNVVISIKSQNAEYCTDLLRSVLADGFKSVLGLKFSAIDFKIVSMKSDYAPDLAKARENAKQIESERAALNEDNTPAQEEAPAEEEEKTVGETETAAAEEEENDILKQLTEEPVEEARRNIL